MVPLGPTRFAAPVGTPTPQVAEQPIRKNLQTVPILRLLYQLGELQDDRALADQQVEWAGRAEILAAFEFSGRATASPG